MYTPNTLAIACFIGFMFMVNVNALDNEDEPDDNSRWLTNDYSNQLIAINSTFLILGLITLGVLGAAALALHYLVLETQGGGYGHGYGYGYDSGYGGYNSYSDYAR